MKVLSFLRDGEIRLGVRRGDRVVDVAAVDPRLPRSVKSLLAAGPEGIARLAATIDVAGPKATYAIDEIEWAPLIPDPGKIVCLGLNFHDHR